eukprot:6184548-Pleurochrysis_carterae.AAC.2
MVAKPRPLMCIVLSRAVIACYPQGCTDQTTTAIRLHRPLPRPAANSRYLIHRHTSLHVAITVKTVTVKSTQRHAFRKRKLAP